MTPYGVSVSLVISFLYSTMTTITAQELITLSFVNQLGLVYLAGILTSFTPCVYPLIPITIALFSGNQKQSRAIRILSPVFYVLGIAITYTSLGLISALTGTLFGSFLSHPVTSLVIGVALLVLFLSALDIVRFQFSVMVQSKAAKIGGGGIVGATLMGIASGVIAAPCTGPVLAAILVVAASTKNALNGGALLFVHALGLGTIFIFLGLWSGAAKLIPRSGRWLGYTKILLATAILLVASMFMTPFLKYVEIQDMLNAEVLLIVSSLVTAAIVSAIGSGQDIKSLKIIGSICLAISLYAGFQNISGAKSGTSTPSTVSGTEIKWASLEVAASNALEKNRPVMVDLFADWCGACIEFDKITFKDDEVIAFVQNNFVAARVDFTIPDESTDELERRFKIVGLPTILFLDSNGEEIPNSRITGFLNAQDFLTHVKRLIPQ